MIHFLKGKVHDITPTSVILDVSGVGYYLGISLQTSKYLKITEVAFLHTQMIIREDAHLLFGFKELAEKEMFNLLISVSGVGAISALILLSSLEISEIANAIINRNSLLLQKVKGIGTKTAERIIVDLKDKALKFSTENDALTEVLDNKVKQESLNALEVLGIPKKIADKIADKILKLEPDIEVENLIKQILKNL